MSSAAAKKFKLSNSTRLKRGNVHTASIIWMHGLGDTANGWKDAMQAIVGRFSFIQCVLPTAPKMSITFQGGQATTAWHDIEDLQNLTKNTFKYKEESRELINELIDYEINEKGIDPQRIVLGGFSQGAAMAIYCGLLYPKRLGGIVALSGYLCDINIVQKVKEKEKKSIPIAMYHGNQDMIVQTQYGRLSAMTLKTNGFNNTKWQEFDIPMFMNMGHSVNQEELTAVAKFINSVLPKEEKQNKKDDKEEEKKNDDDENNQNKDNIPTVD